MIGVHEENIFRLKVSVGEFVVVQKFDRIAELVGDVAHLLHRVGLVVVFSLQKLKIFIRIFVSDMKNKPRSRKR